MKAQRVAFLKPREAVLEGFEQPEHPGRAATFDYPRYPGYGNYGEVVTVGADVNDLAPGDRVLSFSRHASYVTANAGRFALKAPPEMDGRKAVFTRMAGVAITAMR